MLFHIIVPVWGEDFIRGFIDRVLPAHLGAGNLGAFSRAGHDVQLHFYTRAGDERLFTGSALDESRAMMGVFIHAVEDLWYRHKRYILTDLCNRGLGIANSVEAASLFLMADCVLPADGMRRLIALREKGFRAIGGLGFPVESERFNVTLLNGKPHLLKGREFAEVALDCVHPEMQNHVWSDSSIPACVDFLAWNVPGCNGYLVRNLRFMPILIDPMDRSQIPNSTPDVDLVRLAVPDPSRVYLISDSDEMLLASIMPVAERRFGAPVQTEDAPLSIAKWMRYGADPFHVSLFQRQVWIHAGLDESDRRKTAEESDAIVAEILRRYWLSANPFEDVLAKARASGRRLAVFGGGGGAYFIGTVLRLYGLEPACYFDLDAERWGRMIGPQVIARPNEAGLFAFFILVYAVNPEPIVDYLGRLGFVEQRDFVVMKHPCFWE